MPSPSPRVIIAANPLSGAVSSRAMVSALEIALNQRGYAAQVVHSLEEVQRLARDYQQRGTLRAVVSAGGDGTVAALANLLDASIPLLVFPLGTENLLAQYLGLTDDIDQLCETLRSGEPFQIDLGSANGRLFLVILSCGFDAEVVRRMHARRRGHIRRWSYTWPILSTMMHYRFPELMMEIDGERCVASAWMFLFNVPRYAARLEFCPEADPQDGQLDLCTFRRPGILRGLNYLAALRRRRHSGLVDFEHTRIRRMRIPAPLDSRGRPIAVPFQLDGDPGGTLPVDIEVLPKRLCLLRPASKNGSNNHE